MFFAPRATRSLTRQFFPPRNSNRSVFVFGSIGFLLLLWWLVAALYGVVVVLWLSLVVLVWTAQLVVLVTAGPFVLLSRVNRPEAKATVPRFAQRTVNEV